MKKLLKAFLCAAMILGIAGCSSNEGNAGNGSEAPTVYNNFYQTDVDNMDYLVTDKATDSQVFNNFQDGLLENDRYGNIVPSIAESYESNEDATVWTFHLRQGVNWVTATGEVYAEVKAQDFVTGLHHAADFSSNTLNLVQDTIVNLDAYVNGTAEWEEVGVKALDDYTLEYTLTGSTPYFHTMSLYSILYPINEDFLNSKGAGCALGSPDKNSCEFGTPKADSILYNGPFILTTMDAKSKISMKANENYWDLDNVHITEVNLFYDDGSDVYSNIKQFEAGVYASASLSPVWEDYDSYVEKYKDNAYPTMPNSSSFGINFNFNRKIYEDTAHTTDAEKENTRNAILNKNFRLALLHAYGRLDYLKQSASEDVSISMMRNMNNVPTIVTKSDGTTYGQLVTKYYQELTGTDTNLDDGIDAFYNPELALEYIEKAKADGIQFPVTLDVQVISDDSPIYVNRGNSMKNSIETNTNGQILIALQMESSDDVYNTCFYNEDPAMADYDINTFSGWGPDYGDPKSFCDVFDIYNGSYLHTIGLYPYGTNAEDDAAFEQSGLLHYQELIDAADAIKDDLDARYEAYAQADAYLVAEGIYLPQQMQLRGMLVSKIVPFTAPYGVYGICYDYSYKYMELQNDIVTVEQYNAAKAAWEKGE